MLQKVKLGRTDLISAISELTDGEVAKGATASECLAWRERGAGPKTIERCRKWMAEQKKWDIIR